MNFELMAFQPQVEKEKTVQISDLFQDNQGVSLSEILSKIDGGRAANRRKSKIAPKKGHKKRAHHHHHHSTNDDDHDHHHHHEEDAHSHDSNDSMPCVGTIMAFEHEKVGSFNLEMGKEEIHRIIFKAMQFV